jgi:DNA-nicking Smr family endonuclease
MTKRRLGAEERALWARVIATVRPLHEPQPKADEAPTAVPFPAPPPPPKAMAKAPARPATPKPRPGTTLDGSWDRRLSRGLVQPDFTVDLHGHSLHSAYALLDRRLDQAVASGARVLLLITGKPPKERPAGRGKIRDAVGDWIAASRHAGSIAAVRGAHPRHGGSGALYIVLRRSRATTTEI